MARSRSLKTFDIGAVTGQGSSDSAAKTDALVRASAALSGDFDPILLPFRGWTGLAWRGPLGWSSCVVEPGQEVGAQHKYTPRGSTLHGSSARFEVELRLRAHLAQVAWDHTETASPLLEPGDPGLLAKDEPGRRAWADHTAKLADVQVEFASWARWQLRHGRVLGTMMDAGIPWKEASNLADTFLSGMRPAFVLEALQKVGLTPEGLEAAAGAA